MRKVWLLGILCFLGLLFWQLWTAEPYFFFSAHHFFQQAQEALGQGEAARALAAARLAHQKDPQNLDYADFLAWRYLEAQRPQKALDLFRQVWDRRPSPAALRGQVIALDHLGNPQEALHLLEMYLVSHPREISLLQMAGDLASREPATRELATAYYRRLQVLTPENEENRRRLLDLLIAGNHFAEAIPLQEQVVAAKPDDSAGPAPVGPALCLAA